MADAGWYSFDGRQLPIDHGNLRRTLDGCLPTQWMDRERYLASLAGREKRIIDRERFTELTRKDESDGVQPAGPVHGLPEEGGLSETGTADDRED